MKTASLSNKLTSIIETSLRDEECGDCPEGVVSALRKIADIPSHLAINNKHLLVQTEKSNKVIPIIEPLLRKFGITSHCWDQVLTTIEAHGLRPFLTSKGGPLEILVRDIASTVGKHMDHFQKEISQLREDLAAQEQERDNLYKELGTSRKDLSTLVTYLSRDLQMTLEVCGSIKQTGTRKKIREIAEKSLEDMGLRILWEVPITDQGKFFVFIEGPKKGISGTVRPCLLKDDAVLHQGIATGATPQLKEQTNE